MSQQRSHNGARPIRALPAMPGKDALARALHALGRINGSKVWCPHGHSSGDPCQPLDKGPRAVLFADEGRPDDGAVACHKAKHRFSGVSGAVEILHLHGGWSQDDAVRIIMGDDPLAGPKPVDVGTVTPVASTRDKAASDLEVNDWHVTIASTMAAIDHYSRWYISPSSVEAFRFGRVTEYSAYWRHALGRFGQDRMKKAGWQSDKGRNMLGPSYDVLEPQIDPDGNVRYVQLRANSRQEQVIRDSDEYVPKFLGLVGIRPQDQVGFGGHLVAAAPDRSTVWIVEGGKDAAAAHTCGLLAYGMPGAGSDPEPAFIRDHLSRHRVVVALDGDIDSSAQLSERRNEICELLSANGVLDLTTYTLPAQRDVTDCLVAFVEKGITLPWLRRPPKFA